MCDYIGIESIFDIFTSYTVYFLFIIVCAQQCILHAGSLWHNVSLDFMQ